MRQYTGQQQTRWGIVCALLREARCLPLPRPPAPQRALQVAPGFTAIVSGIGGDNAAAAAEQLYRYGCEGLISFGLAAGLHTDSPPLITAATVRSKQAESVPHPAAAALLTRLRQRLQISKAVLAHTDGLLTGSDRKNRLRQATGADAGDMESLALAGFAERQNLPFIAIRAVADGAEDRLPDWLAGAIDAYGRPRPIKMIAAILAHPADWPALKRLQQATQQAERQLRQAGEALLADRAE